MKKETQTTLCPHCNEPLNLGSLIAKRRWVKVSQKARTEIMSRLATGNTNKADWAKKKHLTK